MNLLDFKKFKQAEKKISMVTCYDYWSAKIIAETNIDCVLVGDSLAMIMHGHETPIPASLDLMALHTKAVIKGIGKKFIITDMPFLAHRKGLLETMNAVEKLIQAGAQAVKIEGAEDNLDQISHITKSGIPVMGHLGMQAQAYHQLGGFRVQGKDPIGAKKIFADAKALEVAGCFAVVLECMPADLAQDITSQLTIPTIGIGAGKAVDGQVLVLQDLLGLNPDFNPKFLKKYLAGFELMQQALNQYHEEVANQIFPELNKNY